MRARILASENRKWWTLGAVAFALFMIMLDNTVVNVALPSIQRSLDAGISQLEWVVNGYALTFAVLMLTGGKLADLLGRRKIFLLGLVVFTRRVPRLWPGGIRRRAHRLARGSGRGRRAHDARHARDHLGGLSSPPARARDRHLGGRLGDGARDRAAARRHPHRAHRLELDLLRQRSGRAARADRGR